MNILIIFVVAMMVVGGCSKSDFPRYNERCSYTCSANEEYCNDKCKSLGAIHGSCTRKACLCFGLPDNVPTSSNPELCQE
uniref:Neurotoxin LmNaTx11 n=1 Tax=Lychas mucronatus TaxID=172552 RepID=A0A0U1S9P1_LYCMC|nr:neurotoxin LmNaTx11 precursor [Lychas mucronatus]